MNKYAATIYFKDAIPSCMTFEGRDFLDAQCQVSQLITKREAYNAKVYWDEDYRVEQ
ncbi:MAG: hypothetical protein JKY48_01375 [Flavobacteriales bacterium]|nr:hypothetical protein [Flavobacteriales bacterium]